MSFLRKGSEKGEGAMFHENGLSRRELITKAGALAGVALAANEVLAKQNGDNNSTERAKVKHHRASKRSIA